MLNQSADPIVTSSSVVPTMPTTDRLGVLAGHAKLVETEFCYARDEEIYGEDEPAEYVYQVVHGAVRTYNRFQTAGVKSAPFTYPAMSSG